MIATTSQLAYPSAISRTAPIVRRRITPEAGHALEKLSHAIEYLSDELAIDAGPFTGNRGRIEAIDLLMSLNRRVFAECPEIPSIGQRISAWFHRPA
ncbi:MAG TPA: hypothetical protein VG267_22815 [Terracidiphilus sp.]|jgi:hypothetical protein|nr:hypothetical protein [Terracidiphilus sp.]